MFNRSNIENDSQFVSLNKFLESRIFRRAFVVRFKPTIYHDRREFWNITSQFVKAGLAPRRVCARGSLGKNFSVWSRCQARSLLGVVLHENFLSFWGLIRRPCSPLAFAMKFLAVSFASKRAVLCFFVPPLAFLLGARFSFNSEGFDRIEMRR